jgi:hypothetical protein
VALSNRGWVVAVHKSEFGNSLFYRVGRLDKFSKIIEWREETKLEGHCGTAPVVRFPDMDGLLVEISYLLLPGDRKPLSSSTLFDEDDETAPTAAKLEVTADRRLLTAQIIERAGDWGIELLEGTGHPTELADPSPLHSFRDCCLLPDRATSLHLFSGRSLLSEAPVVYYSTLRHNVAAPPRKMRFRQLFFVEADVIDELLRRYDASPESLIDGNIEFLAASLVADDYATAQRRLLAELPQLFTEATARHKLTRLFPVGKSRQPASWPPVNFLSCTDSSSPLLADAPIFATLPEPASPPSRSVTPTGDDPKSVT